jgi:hypothetical protein
MKPLIIDFNQERAEVLFNYLGNYFEMSSEGNFLSEIDTDTDAVVTQLKNNGVNFLIMHQNNSNAKELITKIPDEIWTILYSGGGINKTYLKDNVFAYSGYFTEQKTKDFLNKVGKVIEELQRDSEKSLIAEKIDEIFAHDYVLEQKLNLLHECLTQKGANDAADSLKNGTDYLQRGLCRTL